MPTLATDRPVGPPPAPDDPVLVGAGDIADCDSPGDEKTAALIEQIPGTVFTAGDNVYLNGTAKEFARCYGPSWGRFKDRTMPAPGNHEYQKDELAGGYFGYFGAAAGDPTAGYYDYTLGSWHVIVLNSNCWAVGGCGPGSPQELWLRSVLASHEARCTVAIAHHPRFSSGAERGSTPAVQPLWQALYDHGADVVLAGHDHLYERFAEQTPAGKADAAFGLRQFTVGTGGRDHRKFGTVVANSEVRNATTWGVLKLTLHPASYDWEFVPEAGQSFTDSGTAACHDAPPTVGYPLPLPETETPVPSTTTPTSNAANPPAANDDSAPGTSPSGTTASIPRPRLKTRTISSPATPPASATTSKMRGSGHDPRRISAPRP
jgi:acid phosphatase type 7